MSRQRSGGDSVSVELAVVGNTHETHTVIIINNTIMLEMNIDTLLQAAEYIERRERGNTSARLCVEKM